MNTNVDSCEKFISFIDRTVSCGKLSHAYLIDIDDDSSYKLIINFVKLILCKSIDIKVDMLNCKKCNICSLIDAGSYPDFKVIEADGSEIKKSQLLNVISEFSKKALMGNYCIYLIKDADRMNLSASNTLLKFLEEPGDNIIAILVTKNRYNIIDTVVSRCQLLSIKEDNEKNDVISEFSLKMLNGLLKNSSSLFVEYNVFCENFFSSKDSARENLMNLKLVFNRILNISVTGIKSDDVFLNSCSDSLSAENLVNFIIIVDDYLNRLNYNVNFKLWIDSFFASLII